MVTAKKLPSHSQILFSRYFRLNHETKSFDTRKRVTYDETEQKHGNHIKQHEDATIIGTHLLRFLNHDAIKEV